MTTQAQIAGDWQKLFQIAYDGSNFNLIETSDDFNKWIDERDATEFQGGDSIERLYTMTRGSGARYVSDGANGTSAVIPTYVAPSYQYAQLYPFLAMGSIVFDGRKLERAKKNKWLYRDLFESASVDFVDSTVDANGAIYFGDGTGTRALIETSNTYVAAMDVPVKDRDVATKAYKTYGGARYLTEGMQIRIGTPAEHVNKTADYAVITHVDFDAETVKLDRQVTVAENDIITRGDANGSEYNMVPSGLALAVGDENSAVTSYHGIDRATAGNRRWSSIIKRGANNTLRPYSNALVEQALFQLKKQLPKGRGLDKIAMFSDNSLLQVYISDGEADYIKTNLSVIKGHETLAFQWGARRIPWQDIDTCPYNELYIGDFRTLQRLKWSDWAWWAGDGQAFRLVNSNTWAVSAFCHKEMELDLTNPRTWIRIEDLEVPTFTIS